ncbi:MAG: RecX family transcriptional regulator [Prevotella sp.]|nr:RecX family transcriptional regulator [Prevotella sp.]
MTKEQVLYKLTSLCARAEYCQHDMLEKMRKWEVNSVDKAEIMEYLLREKYVDEERYARHFISDKLRFNKWGRRKVEQALNMKRIPESIYRPILDEQCEEDYEDILMPLLRNKLRTVKGKNSYDIRNKIIRFALSRGFETDLVLKAVDKLQIGGDDGDCLKGDSW